MCDFRAATKVHNELADVQNALGRTMDALDKEEGLCQEVRDSTLATLTVSLITLDATTASLAELAKDHAKRAGATISEAERKPFDPSMN